MDIGKQYRDEEELSKIENDADIAVKRSKATWSNFQNLYLK